MHKYLVELYLNDENGNPKGRDGFQYFDNEINLQAYYEEKRNTYQQKTVVGEDGQEQTITTVNHKWTVKVSECKYIAVENPADIFARVRG